MIRIITEPTIYLVGRLKLDENSLSRFLKDEGVDGWKSDSVVDNQVIPEIAGRLCYKSYSRPRPGGNRAYLERILSEAHGSVLESSVYNFIITGVSRSLTHELVRHRAGMAYSQRSQRYVDESDVAFVAPPLILQSVVEAGKQYKREQWETCSDYMDYLRNGNHSIPDPDLYDGLAWLEFIEKCSFRYQLLCDSIGLKLKDVLSQTARRKKSREAARSVLPNCTETQIFVTANARALRGVLEQRGVPGADAEIRRLAVMWAKMMIVEAPNLFQDYRIESDDDGEYVAFRFKKV